MEIPGYEKLTHDQFIARLERVIKSASAKESQRKGTKYKVLSYKELSEKTQVDIKTIFRWRKGQFKTLPNKNNVAAFCGGLGMDPLIFSCGDRITPEEQMLISNRIRADELGIIESFVLFLRDSELHELISDLIPIDKENYEGYTGVQFTQDWIDTDEHGEGKYISRKVYPDRRTALVIRALQDETIEMIKERIKEICLISNTFDNPEAFDSYLEKIANLDSGSNLSGMY